MTVAKNLFEQYQNSAQKTEINVHLFIVIPAYEEQNVICSTLDHFDKILFSYLKSEKIIFIIALDEKEKEAQKKMTTKGVVEKYLEEHPRLRNWIQTVEYGGEGRSRAKQLNEALNWIQTRSLDPSQVWIAVYDADSKPHAKTFDYFFWKIQEDPDLKTFQQTIDYRLNEEALVKNRILWANSVHHTARTYLSEMPLFIYSNEQIRQGKKSEYPPYYMGHGEFIRLDLLKQIGGFPIAGFCDGIQMGCLISICDQPTEIIPYPDFCESPVSLHSLITQHSMWFSGLLSVFPHLLRHKERGMITMKRCLFYFNRCAIWLLCPLFFLVLLALSLYGLFDHSLSLVSLSSFIFLSGSIWIYARMLKWASGELNKIYGRENKVNSSQFWIWMVLSISARSLGPWVAIFRGIKSRLCRTPLSFQKTAR